MEDIKEKYKLFVKELKTQSERNNLNLYAVKDKFLLSMLNEINIDFDKKEISQTTIDQYFNLVKNNFNKKPIKEVLFNNKSKGGFDKTRSAYKYVIADQIIKVRSRMDRLRVEAKKNPENKEEIYKEQDKLMNNILYMAFQYKDCFIDNKRTYKDLKELNEVLNIDEAKNSKKYTMKKAADNIQVLEKMMKNKKVFNRHALRFSVISNFGCRPAELNNILLYQEDGYIYAEIAGKKVNNERGQNRRKLGVLIDKEDLSHKIILSLLKNKGNLILKSNKSDYNSLRKYITKNFENTSLYSYRHIVASKLKNTISDVELAQFLGHRSTASAKSYGNRRTGKNWLKPIEDFKAEGSDKVVVKETARQHFENKEIIKNKLRNKLSSAFKNKI